MKLAGVPKKECRTKAKELLEQVGLGNRMNYLPKQLSGGQRQRVAIARAFANNPQILFADEPTGNLDTSTGDSIFELLRQFNLRGQTIVMVTHNNEFAKRSGRVIYMKDGKLLD